METAQLIAALAAEKLVGDARADELLARAGGNPLYAEEYMRMLAEPGGNDDLPLPETVQGIIAARLDTLAPEEKALLQDAAVVGKVFWVGALEAVGSRPQEEVGEGLLRLERKEFIRRERRSSVAGETAFVFRHVLVRDIAYGQIPRPRRADAHRLAAEWLEGLAGDRAEDLADLIAHHYLSALQFARTAGLALGDLPDRARHALREAGDRALALSAYAAAARFYREALASWPEDDPERPTLLLRYGQALFRSEGGGADTLAQAASELLAADEVELAAEAEMLLAELLMSVQGRTDDSVTHLEHAVSLLADRPATRSKAWVLAGRAQAHLALDEAEDAIESAQQALRMAEELNLDELRAHTLSTLGFARVMTGDLDGLDGLRRSVDLAAALNSPQAARGLNHLASVTAELGDLAQAFELYGESRRVAERFGDVPALRWLDVEAMYEHYWRGDWAGALETGADLMAGSGEGAGSQHELDVLLIGAKIALARCGPEPALEEAERALELARGVGAPQILFPALAFDAHALAAAGRADEGARTADELVRLWLDEGRGLSLASFWLADLAFALAELDRAADLGRALARARTRTRWLEAAEAVAAEDWARAAGIFADIGSLPDEALAREKAEAQAHAPAK